MQVLLTMTILSGIALSSSFVSADTEVVDQINITVPVSCTISGTGTNSHNAVINNGQYNSAIGETTVKATCNLFTPSALLTIRQPRTYSQTLHSAAPMISKLVQAHLELPHSGR